jgi:hypothetical protein
VRLASGSRTTKRSGARVCAVSSALAIYDGLDEALEHRLRLKGLTRGLVTLCIGGGQGIALFNALLLQRNNKHAEAAEYWRRYLANDAQSEWAARARRSSKFCEMQIHLSAS